MKKLTIITLVFMFLFFGIAFAAATTAPQATNYTDVLVKSALAALMTALAAVISMIVPIIAKKGDSLTDALWTALKNYAKKIENERIQARLNQFFDVLNKGTDQLWEIAGKVKVDKVDGKVVVTNLDELTTEINTKVKPELTNSTKDLAKELGVDAEAYIKERIQARAQVILR